MLELIQSVYQNFSYWVYSLKAFIIVIENSLEVAQHFTQFFNMVFKSLTVQEHMTYQI